MTTLLRLVPLLAVDTVGIFLSINLVAAVDLRLVCVLVTGNSLSLFLMGLTLAVFAGKIAALGLFLVYLAVASG